MGEADAIGSPIIQESKAEGRRRRIHWFTGGFICPLRVTCRLRTVAWFAVRNSNELGRIAKKRKALKPQPANDEDIDDDEDDDSPYVDRPLVID